jgi:hypothetical protein
LDGRVGRLLVGSALVDSALVGSALATLCGFTWRT